MIIHVLSQWGSVNITYRIGTEDENICSMICMYGWAKIYHPSKYQYVNIISWLFKMYYCGSQDGKYLWERIGSCVKMISQWWIRILEQPKWIKGNDGYMETIWLMIFLSFYVLPRELRLLHKIYHIFPML